MKRVIIIIMTMIFTLPLLTTSSWLQEEEAFEFGLKLINKFDAGTDAFNAAFDNYVDNHVDFRNPLISLAAYDKKWFDEDADLDNL